MTNGIYRSDSLKGYIRSRPIRVAFVIEDGEDAHIALDAIFSKCHAHWGGRFNIVVPFANGEISSEWLNWLEVYDPDIIYSYVNIDERLLRALYERFGPAFIVEHQPYSEREHDKRYFRPELPFDCLTSLSVAPQYARAYPPSSPQPIYLVDYIPGQKPDRFIDDNFGSPLGCFDYWPLPDHLNDVLRTISFGSEDAIAKHSQNTRKSFHDAVNDIPSLLKTLSIRRNAYGLSQLSADSVPRLDYRDHRREAFALIIGDSFNDRLLYWNIRSLLPSYFGREFVCLIISKESIFDEAYFDALVEFLKVRNSVRPNQNTPTIQVSSTSVEVHALKEIIEKLNSRDRWNYYTISNINRIEDIIPDSKSRRYVGDLTTALWFSRENTWREFPVSGPSVNPPSVLPQPILGLNVPSRATTGAWALDLEIERANNLTRFSNVQHTWRLPRRLRLHGAFRGAYEGLSHGHYRYSRATQTGFLSVFVDFLQNTPEIHLPDDETVFRYGLERGNDWPSPTRSASPSGPDGFYGWTRPSDKGRYLIGALELFGGLQNCGSVLLHSFWKSVFDQLGGAAGADRREQIKKTLKKKIKNKIIENEGDWDRLASLVSNEAHQVRLPLRVLNFDILEMQHQALVEEEHEEIGGTKTDSSDSWAEDAKESLRRSVQWLCSRGVLHQGYEWRCHNCFNSNWSQIGSLKAILNCEVCGNQKILPVNKSWDFRLNTSLRDALREHGLLALIWCLLKLEGRAKQSFYYTGPRELFSHYPNDNNDYTLNEADLLCVVDGKVHLCEVKSSSRDISVTSIIDVAKKIRPDTVVLAVLEEKSQRVESKFNEIRITLRLDGINSELLTLKEGDFSRSSYLPS